MKAIRILCSTVLVAVLALPTLSHADNRRTSDTWLESKIVTTFTLNPNLNPFEIDANVKDGKAVLSGTVDEAIDKDLAEEVAKSVDGIKAVENNITVEPGKRSAEKKGASFSQAISDASTTASVKSKLLWNRHTNGLGIDVTTKQNVVTLTGEVKDKAVSDLAERLAENTSGVKSVSNKLEVKSADAEAKLGSVNLDKMAENAGDAVGDVGAKIGDGWITTKVSTTLAFTRGLDSSDIEVDTKSGVVYLKGWARTAAEKELAEELASGVKGVKDVNNLLKETS